MMGSDSFYLKVKFETADIAPIMEKYGGICKMTLTAKGAQSVLRMEGPLVSFLPVSTFMFDVCSEIRRAGAQQIELESRRLKYLPDHMERTDFAVWLYQIWAENLQFSHEQYGGFMMSPRQFSNTRDKFDKFFIRCPKGCAEQVLQ
ncbi:MAG: hypothetical protein IK130_07515 [Oscillospiraceae bacterium]|nr:hypothetical protein [Oscillospiraceae bacterium]